MFKIVTRIWGRYTHGKLAGRVNPKHYVDLTTYREGVIERSKSGAEHLAVDMKELKGYLRKEFGDAVTQFQTIELVGTEG